MRETTNESSSLQDLIQVADMDSLVEALMGEDEDLAQTSLEELIRRAAMFTELNKVKFLAPESPLEH